MKKEDDEYDKLDKPEGDFQISQAIVKDKAFESPERVNVQAKMKQPIAKKKLAAMKKSQM